MQRLALVGIMFDMIIQTAILTFGGIHAFQMPSYNSAAIELHEEEEAAKDWGRIHSQATWYALFTMNLPLLSKCHTNFSITGSILNVKVRMECTSAFEKSDWMKG